MRTPRKRDRIISVKDPEGCEKEWEQVADRSAKLSTFINVDPEYHTLPVKEQVRLRVQLIFMREYLNVLRERIDSQFS